MLVSIYSYYYENSFVHFLIMEYYLNFSFNFEFIILNFISIHIVVFFLNNFNSITEHIYY